MDHPRGSIPSARGPGSAAIRDFDELGRLDAPAPPTRPRATAASRSQSTLNPAGCSTPASPRECPGRAVRTGARMSPPASGIGPRPVALGPAPGYAGEDRRDWRQVARTAGEVRRPERPRLPPPSNRKLTDEASPEARRDARPLVLERMVRRDPDDESVDQEAFQDLRLQVGEERGRPRLLPAGATVAGRDSHPLRDGAFLSRRTSRLNPASSKRENR